MTRQEQPQSASGVFRPAGLEQGSGWGKAGVAPAISHGGQRLYSHHRVLPSQESYKSGMGSNGEQWVPAIYSSL